MDRQTEALFLWLRKDGKVDLRWKKGRGKKRKKRKEGRKERRKEGKKEGKKESEFHKIQYRYL